MTLNPIELINKLIIEHGSSIITKEHLLFLKEKLSDAEKECADLVKKCTNLEREVATLTDKLNKKQIPEEFTEYMGALFKKDPSGSYTPIAHCPECKRPLWNTSPGVFPYQCSTQGCNYTITIHENLTSIVEKLNKQNS